MHMGCYNYDQVVVRSTVCDSEFTYGTRHMSNRILRPSFCLETVCDDGLYVHANAGRSLIRD